ALLLHRPPPPRPSLLSYTTLFRSENDGPMVPPASADAGGTMIWTTRTIGLLLTMAMLTGGAVWGVHALIASAGGAGSDYGLDTNGNGKFEWLVVEAQVSLPKAGTWDVS